jgi:hypothetical protein
VQGLRKTKKNGKMVGPQLEFPNASQVHYCCFNLLDKYDATPVFCISFSLF